MSLRRTLVLSAAAVGCNFNVAAHAQTDAGAGSADTLQTIVVTAERRPSTVQKTAASVSVRDGEDLKVQGKSTLTEILEDVPGVTPEPPGLYLNQTDQPGGNVVIRGIQPAIGNQNEGIPTTAVYTDGVYSGIGGDYDIGNYQILRGPQGTLYGRNATAGVVAITTNDPVLNKFGGEGTLEVGNYGLSHETAVLNVPISDTVAARFAGNEYQTHGYVSAEGGRSKLEEGKAKLLYSPNSDLSILLGAAIQDHHISTGGIAQNLIAPDVFLDKSEAIATGMDEFRQYWANVNYNFGAANLTYIPAYRTWYENSPSILNGPNQTVISGGQFVPTDSFLTQELRLASNPGSRLTWLVGAFYYDNKLQNNSKEEIIVPSVSPIAAANMYTDTQDYGLFEDASYPIADTWTLTEGMRFDYTHVGEQVQYTAASNPFGLAPVPNIVTTSSISGSEGIRDFRNVTFRARIEKQLTPDNTLYAMVSSGFLPGDVQATTTTINSGPNAGEAEATVSTYDEERLIAYEIGSKNRFLDNRLQANADFFYYDYSGYQAVTETGVTNIGGQVLTSPVRSYGPELELNYLLTPQDKVGLNYDYINAQYVNEPVVFANAVANKAVPGIPKNAVTVTYDHTLPLSGGSTLDFFADMRYTSGYPAGNILPAAAYVVGGVQYGCPDSWQTCAAYNQISQQFVGDANITWRSADSKYSVTGYIRNLADNAYKSGATVTGFGPSFTATGTTYQPRLLGVVLNGKF